MNIHTLKYDDSLLDFFRFDMDKLQYVYDLLFLRALTNPLVFLKSFGRQMQKHSVLLPLESFLEFG